MLRLSRHLSLSSLSEFLTWRSNRFLILEDRNQKRGPNLIYSVSGTAKDTPSITGVITWQRDAGSRTSSPVSRTSFTHLPCSQWENTGIPEDHQEPAAFNKKGRSRDREAPCSPVARQKALWKLSRNWDLSQPSGFDKPKNKSIKWPLHLRCINQ